VQIKKSNKIRFLTVLATSTHQKILVQSGPIKIGQLNLVKQQLELKLNRPICTWSVALFPTKNLTKESHTYQT